MSNSLPTRLLGDVITITKGRKPPRLTMDATSNALPYATTDFFRSGISTQFVPPADLSSCVITQQGNPVLIWDGSNAGEVFAGKTAVLASTMAQIKTDETVINPGFCYFFLKTAFRELNEDTTGSTIPHVSKLTLTALKIPVLPLADQALITAFLFRIERAIAVQNQLLKAAHELKRSTMRELFTRGLRGEAQKETEIGLVPDSWDVVSLGSLGKIGNGTTPNRTKTEYWNGGTVPWITSGRMYERNIEGSDHCVTPLALRDNSLPLLQPGAVLIAIVGQGKTLGHCAILRVEATVSRHVGFIQPDTNIIIPEYLRDYLESQYQYLRQLASGNGSTRGALTCAILRSLRLSLPQIDEQHEVAGILDAIDRKIDLHKRKKAVLEELFQSLLHKLMTGEIRIADLDLSTIRGSSTSVVKESLTTAKAAAGGKQ